MSTPEQRDPQAPSPGQQQHDEDALDEALDESFPASDPVAVNTRTPNPGKAAPAEGA